jgi:hypothetical protein
MGQIGGPPQIGRPSIEGALLYGCTSGTLLVSWLYIKFVQQSMKCFSSPGVKFAYLKMSYFVFVWGI